MPPRKRTAATSARKRSAAGSGAGAGAAAAATGMSGYGQPELIVVTNDDAGIRVRGDSVASAAGADHRGLSNIAGLSGVTMTPLFGPEERVMREADFLAPTAMSAVPDLTVFYHVDAPAERLADLAEELNAMDEVAGAYVKPAGEPPVMNDMEPAEEDAPPASPDFSARQGYLDAAPGGIDARYAWTWPGGGGAGVSIIDCEWGWRFDHEDLVTNQGGIVVGTGGTDTNHGTAVIGEISGDRNSIGVTGICPDARIMAAAFSMPTAQVIRAAANRLVAGDLILLEIHRAGPRNNFQARQDQLGYIAIEWWPDDFAAIAFAVSRGIIVVEAAGNGAENLDSAIYSTRPAGFPTSWTNPFNRSNRDSGAVVVGAGAPPPGTHGRNHGADRSRLDFSNYGALIDAQGWGREVTSTGYGNLQGGADARFWYTDTFSGTSSASPIVTGALGALQGARRAAGRPRMTPANARAWLRATGSPQQSEPGRPASQRIGNRPNLRQLIQAHVKSNVTLDVKSIKELKLEKSEAKDLKEASKEIEVKRVKDGKELVKETVKDTKELKETVKDTKEVKEGIKDVKEIREGKLAVREGKLTIENKVIENKVIENKVVENKVVEIQRGDLLGGIRQGIGPSIDDIGLDERLANLEAAVVQLAHFITDDLRPDLSSGALTREADLWADADAAKANKDYKDKEHLLEG